MLEVYRVNIKVISLKTGTVSVVSYNYNKHLACAKQKLNAKTKEAGSQRKVPKVQQTIRVANGTNSSNALH